jgi:hypothetical protein
MGKVHTIAVDFLRAGNLILVPTRGERFGINFRMEVPFSDCALLYKRHRYRQIPLMV